jgi:cobalt-zinc-cadmium efflux system outer membrane protein
MRKLLIPLLVFFMGCHAWHADVLVDLEAQVAAVGRARAVPDAVACEAAPPALPEHAGLPDLWNLALANNPALREAAAETEAARGRLTQAGLYPNPRLLYDQNTIGSRLAREGNINVQLQQEIVTAGKRRLDLAVAGRQVDVASLALLGRKFEVLTRVRRAYAAYAAWVQAERANEGVVGVLRQGQANTRKLVKAKLRPRTDLLRIEALLEEAQISLARARANRVAAWRELAAEVGTPALPPPAEVGEPLPALPDWPADAVVGRVLAANSAIKQAAVDAERARLALERAKAQAVPNVTVGGGYAADNIERTAGAIVTVETPLPVWNCNQGNIHAAQAGLSQAQAAVRSTQMRLSRETAAALGAYEAARQQVDRLERRVLPKLRESLTLLSQGYQAGAAQVGFLDVLLAEQALFTAQVTLAEGRRNLWLAVADLQGLMQLDLGEELCSSQ